MKSGRVKQIDMRNVLDTVTVNWTGGNIDEFACNNCEYQGEIDQQMLPLFENTKYVFTDVSSSKKFALYPMRIRVSSERQKRYVLELITLISEENMLRIGGAQ
jgi:DNA-dependent RNA polymerase auxiliary subunit epsilon